MITVNGGSVYLTEQTVRELLSAIEKAKKVTEFTNDPMPDGDMCEDYHTLLKRERGQITVSSTYSGIKYVIDVEKRPHSMESLGYKLDMGEKPKPAEESAILISKEYPSNYRDT